MLRLLHQGFTLFFIISIALFSCKTAPKETVSADDNFNAYKESFIEDLWKHYPVMASSVGYHNYDSVLIVPDAASMEVQLAFVKHHMDELAKIDEKALSVNNRTDYLMIRDQLDLTAWNVNSYKGYEWDPSTYNVTGTFAEMLNGSMNPLKTGFVIFTCE